MRKFFKEFKEFVSRGNVLNLAVGIIIGAAFTAIVNSLVGDIIMPLIALLGGKDITEWHVVLNKAAVEAAGEQPIMLQYGMFLQAVINFLLIAFVLFLIIKVVMGVSARAEALATKLKGAEAVEEEPQPEPEPELSAEVQLLMEIRDALVTEKPSSKK